LPSCDGIALADVGTNAPLRRQKKAFKSRENEKTSAFFPLSLFLRGKTDTSYKSNVQFSEQCLIAMLQTKTIAK